MILYIAEKPSLGRAIADALPKPQRKQEGCIYLGNGDCVSWCIGHLLEQAEPDRYDPAYKQWKLEHLPITPQRWLLTPRSNSRKQLAIVKKLIKQADQLVHAGDPDREGQLLVDELINYVKTSDTRGIKQGKYERIQRCLINDLTPAAVTRALSELHNNRDYIPLATSALARSRADWLYGINMTRALTLQGRKVGYQGLLSVGRVQTPILGLVVSRDQLITAFVSKPFYEVQAQLVTAAGESFTATWQPSDACAAQMDDDGRVLSKKLATLVAQRITDKVARVDEVKTQQRRLPPPLPYNLSALQIDAAKRFGLTPQQVLDNCQSLYERHKLITYPRSDCRYLPAQHHQQAKHILQQMAQQCPALSTKVTEADHRHRTKAWNDSKVSAHHAIIPTLASAAIDRLSRTEQQIYELIARQYLCQFFQDHRFLETRVQLTIENGVFIAKGKQIIDQGWKTLFTRSDNATSEAANQPLSDDKKPDIPVLPALTPQQTLNCRQGVVNEKHTQAPKPFTDATLLAAITGIARFVEDPAIRKILKETDGLGTEATRAGIIELLFKRGFLQRQGKQIHPTEAGKGLIASLPVQAGKADMTARWESQLNAISQRQVSYQQFMQPLLGNLNTMLAETIDSLPTPLKGAQAPRSKSPTARKRKTRKKRTNNA